MSSNLCWFLCILGLFAVLLFSNVFHSVCRQVILRIFFRAVFWGSSVLFSSCLVANTFFWRLQHFFFLKRSPSLLLLFQHEHDGRKRGWTNTRRGCLLHLAIPSRAEGSLLHLAGRFAREATSRATCLASGARGGFGVYCWIWILEVGGDM